MKLFYHTMRVKNYSNKKKVLFINEGFITGMCFKTELVSPKCLGARQLKMKRRCRFRLLCFFCFAVFEIGPEWHETSGVWRRTREAHISVKRPREEIRFAPVSRTHVIDGECVK